MRVKCPECKFVNDVDFEEKARFVCEECGSKLRRPGTPAAKARKKSEEEAPDNTTRNIVGGVVLIGVLLLAVGVWGWKLGWFGDANKNKVAEKNDDDAPARVNANRKAPVNRDPDLRQGGRGKPGSGVAPQAKAGAADEAAYRSVLGEGILARPSQSFAADMKESTEEDPLMVLGNLKASGRTPQNSDFYTFTQKFTGDTAKKKYKLCVSFDGTLYEQNVFLDPNKTGATTFGIDTYNLKKSFTSMQVWFEMVPDPDRKTRGNKVCKPVTLSN